jgi:hypothetical protein
VADFTKEISYEKTAVGFEDEGEDCVGGVVGHGGHDPGALTYILGFTEDIVNLMVAHRLSDLLN